MDWKIPHGKISILPQFHRSNAILTNIPEGCFQILLRPSYISKMYIEK